MELKRTYRARQESSIGLPPSHEHPQVPEGG
jgi:hypothetical protein